MIYKPERPNCNTGIGDRKYFETSYGNRGPEAYSWILGEMIRFGRPGSVIDLGCGTGLFVELAAMWGIEAIGYEGSVDAIQLALNRAPFIKIQHGFLSDPLPWADGTFDNALLNQVIEHLPQNVFENALKETFRILRSGGVIFVFSPSKANVREVAKDPTHCNPQRPSGLRSNLEAAGFRVFREPNAPLFFGGTRLLRRVSNALLRTRFRDRISATSNAFANRP